ncbi:tetratricopeptide repeat-containing sensor histidine kinase [Cecembia sp.]|uniref:sensor histidine kinase n=1 Tax=Cecembia sp. TaxID=1898110 RepID=UPI0025C1D0E7|nr:tetratricopeptide repeat-containing sensor histidine kinase [Cecembia sp.]
MKTVVFYIVVFLFFLFESPVSWAIAQNDEVSFENYIEKSRSFRYDNFDSAVFYAKKAEEIALKEQDEHLLLRLRGQQGGIYYVAGKYSQSLTFYSEAYQLALKLNDQKELAIAINGRGLIALGQHEYRDAVGFFEEALELNRSLKDDGSVVRNLFNLGISLSELGEYEEALQALQMSKEMALDLDDQIHINMNYNRLGRVYYELQQYDSARWYYTALLDKEAQLNNWERTFLFSGLAELDFQKGDFQSAIENGQKSLQIAEGMGVFWDMERATKILWEAYEGLDDTEMALQFAKLNKAYGDSLYNREKSQEISFLKLQLSKVENERLQREKQMIEQKAKFNSYFMWGLILLIALLLGLLFSYRRNLRLKTRFGEQLKSINSELEQQKKFITQQNISLNEMNLAKDKLFSILSHDLKAPIATVKQFLEMNSDEMMNKEELQQAIPLLYLQVDKTEKMMENLLSWAKTQMGGIQSKQELVGLLDVMQEVIDNFENQCRMKGIKVFLRKSEFFDKVLFDRVQLIVVLQNIFYNAVKFSSKGQDIQIFLSKNDDFLNLHILDFGVGMEESRRIQLEKATTFVESRLGADKELGTGLGLFLVKQFMHMNQGKISIQGRIGEGTEVILSFPPIKEQQKVGENPNPYLAKDFSS